MRTIGVIRRVDDLGRVVIPKEVRQALSIHENDPLEIFYDKDGVYFKKRRPEASLFERTQDLLADIWASEDIPAASKEAIRSSLTAAIQVFADIPT